MMLDLPDDASTAALGAALARALLQCAPSAAAVERDALVIGLRGDLGAGKTTLARGLLRALGHRGPVPSPTYTLVEPYELGVGSVFHIDLYRVTSAEEIRYLGLEDCLGQDLQWVVWLVEWPERGDGAIPDLDLEIHLKTRGNGRVAEVAAGTARGQALLAAARLPVAVES